MPETIHVRGEGGAVIAMDLPLPESIAERLAKGQLKRVNADGSPYTEAPDDTGQPPPARVGGSAQTAGTVPRPGAAARKPDWVLWAVAVHGLDEADAEGMTLAALKELPEQPTPAAGADAAPAAKTDRPADEDPKSAWIDYIARRGLLSREDAAAYTKADLIDMVG